MDVASMGWIAVGMGRLTEPSKPLTTEDAEDTEEFLTRLVLGIWDYSQNLSFRTFSFFF